MQYRWENRTDKGVAVNEKLDDMPQYNLTGATTTSYFTGYYSGGCIADKSPLVNMCLDLVDRFKCLWLWTSFQHKNNL